MGFYVRLDCLIETGEGVGMGTHVEFKEWSGSQYPRNKLKTE